MEALQAEFPLLSFVLFHLDPTSHPPLPPLLHQNLLSQFPYLNHPKVLSSLTHLIPNTSPHTLSLLASLGPPPDPDTVSSARSMIAQMGYSAEAEVYRAVVKLEEMQEECRRELRGVEERLVGAYKEVVRRDLGIDEEVLGVLKVAVESGGILERLDLSGRELRLVPDAFGDLRGLLVLNLSHNLLQTLPDSIGGLEKLEELDVSSNLLESLPDSIGLLRNLKVFNVSGNKLDVLPESIALCRSLVELDVSFNNLMSLPTNIGYGLVNLEKLSIQLNKIHFLPPSICEMKSLRYLDLHFNELRGLPHAIGRLTNLEILNLSSNFSDLTDLPETIGDLINLRELDLSNNQIRALPDTFGRLERLTKLNLDENPLEIPPKEIVNKGVEAIREFMLKRWQDMIVEEQRRVSMLDRNQQQTQTGWLTWGTSLLSNLLSGVSQSVSGYIGGSKTPRDPYLDQQL